MSHTSPAVMIGLIEGDEVMMMMIKLVESDDDNDQTGGK